MRPMTLAFSLGVLTVMLAGATSASAAQTCTTTTDCPHGFVCEINQVTPPSTTVCTKEGPCPAAAEVAPDVAAVAGSCVPATCGTNADCASDMVCHSETFKSCSGSGSSGGTCAPNTKCAEPVITETCTEETVSACAYKWQLPCMTDSDCGAAFTCAPSVQTTCPTRSGGSGTSSSSGAGGSASSGGAVAPTKDDGGSASPGDVAECTSTTAFPGYCQPKATTCTVDTDCPSAWTCVELPAPGTVTGTGGTAVNGAGVSSTDASDDPKVAPAQSPAIDASTTPPDATPAQKVCLSPFGGVAHGGGTATSGSDGNPLTPPTNNKGAEVQDSAGAGPSTSSGCTVATNAAGARSSWAFAGLSLVGLALAARRRRAGR